MTPCVFRSITRIGDPGHQGGVGHPGGLRVAGCAAAPPLRQTSQMSAAATGTHMTQHPLTLTTILHNGLTTLYKSPETTEREEPFRAHVFHHASTTLKAQHPLIPSYRYESRLGPTHPSARPVCFTQSNLISNLRSHVLFRPTLYQLVPRCDV